MRSRSHWLSASDAFLWALALALVCALMIVTEYIPRDPDSRFYIFVVEQIVDLPLKEWIAPQWLGHQGIPPGQFIKDHLIGHPLTGALIAQLGIPASQSLQVFHLITQLVSYQLLAFSVSLFFSRMHGKMLLIGLQLIPIAFLYRVQANHEQTVLLLIICALFLHLRALHNPLWLAGMIPVAIMLFLVKGAVVFILPLLTLLVLGIFRTELPQRRIFSMAALPVGAAIAIALTALAYEEIFREVTGEAFFSDYFRIQVLNRSLLVEHRMPAVVAKIYNISFYGGCLLWYSAPWSMSAFWLALKHGMTLKLPRLVAKVGVGSRRQAQGYALLIGLSLLYWGAFSLSDRIAVRYIFPAYYFLSAASLMYLLQRSTTAQRWAQHLSRLGMQKIAAGLWTIMTSIHILTTSYSPLP